MSIEYHLYQEVTKNLNDYYYGLKDFVCIKLIRTKTNDSVIEIHILNEDFEEPLRLRGLGNDECNTLIMNISSDINRLEVFLKAYATDVSNQTVNQSTKDYVNKMIAACVKSIEKYEVFTFAISDLNLPEHDLNYILLGNLSAKPIKKDLSLSKLSLRYTIRQLFPDITKPGLVTLIKKYSDSFIDLCMVVDKKGRTLYH